MVAKQLELYERLVPGLRRVLTLVDPNDPSTKKLLPQYRSAAAQLPPTARARHPQSLDCAGSRAVFGSLRPGEVDAAFLLSTNLRLNHSALTIRLARKAGIPVHAHRKEWVEKGALFSFGADLYPIGRAGARYVDSILKGTAPPELSVETVPDVELAINLEDRRQARDQAAAGDDPPGRQGLPVAPGHHGGRAGSVEPSADRIGA